MVGTLWSIQLESRAHLLVRLRSTFTIPPGRCSEHLTKALQLCGQVQKSKKLGTD